jgi:glycosyltransferase involved in cell wall biosynthesis
MLSTSLSIGLLAPPWVPVPPPAYGGTELVVGQLACELDRLGHRVTLFATRDSTCRVPKAAALSDAAPAERIGQSVVELNHVMAGYEALAGCDIVHDHTLVGPAWAAARGRDRVVTTCHGPLDGDLHGIYLRYGKLLPLVAISADQAARAPDIAVDRVIHHGICPDEYPPGEGDGGYLLFLGRMTPEKGAREAALTARAAGVPLLLAAKKRERAECEYFAAEVAPLLGGDVEYVGEADHERKLELLRGARALLNPICWPEPFGLVMLEALACGTPVLSHPVGAAPEIVTHGVTGFLCPDRAALVAAVHRVSELDRAACRREVAERFCTTRMVAEHLALYEDLIRR